MFTEASSANKRTYRRAERTGTGRSPHPHRHLFAMQRIPHSSWREFRKSSREFVAVAFLCMQIKEASFQLISLRKAVESELLCSPAGKLNLRQQCAMLKEEVEQKTNRSQELQKESCAVCVLTGGDRDWIIYFKKKKKNSTCGYS